MGKQDFDFLESWNRERGRVIIFSGVFDPVHNGHLAVAEAALKTEGNLVIFLPERIPQHKHGRTAFEDRVAMLKIALAGQSKMHVMESPFAHHTIAETLTWLQNQFPSGQNFGLLLGADTARYLSTWPGIERLAAYNVDRLIVADRVLESVADVSLPQIEGVTERTVRARNNHLTSTLIRQDPANRASALPEGVLKYIGSHKLYMSAVS